MKSSRRIDIAMGILLAQLRMREDEASNPARHASQSRTRKLRDLAEAVILLTLEP